jgi:tetratricopeptide (TPR) repeat protein
VWRGTPHFCQSTRALKINREVQDRRSEGYTLGNLGAAYATLGEHQRALELFKQNLAIAREMNDRQSEGYALFGSSLSLWEIGDRAEAMVNAETALKVLEEIEDFTTAKVREQLAKWRGRID